MHRLSMTQVAAMRAHGPQAPVWAMIGCLIALATSPARGQDDEGRDDAWLRNAAAESFFHLDVTGHLAGTTGQPGPAESRWGKAFAIGPNLLLTANHVFGDWSEWAPRDEPRREVARAVRPIDRDVALLAADQDPDRPIRDLVLLPAFSPAVDAATLLVPGLDLAPDVIFQLSLCPIREGEPYAALLVTDDPQSSSSMSGATAVGLVAEGFQPATYGGLYVFALDGGQSFDANPDGHDGSPILDASKNVVAIVSAVTRDGGRTRILATPIQPLIPGTDLLLSQAPTLAGGTTTRPKCSMADLVGVMDYNVSTHAIWSVSSDRDNAGPTGLLKFTYDSIYRAANVKSIQVEYEFYGRKSSDGPYTRLPLAGGGDRSDGFIEIPQRSETSRVFRDAEILDAARQTLMPSLSQRGGEISFVQLRITPTYLGLEHQSSEPVEIGLAWSDLVTQ